MSLPPVGFSCAPAAQLSNGSQDATKKNNQSSNGDRHTTFRLEPAYVRLTQEQFWEIFPDLSSKKIIPMRNKFW